MLPKSILHAIGLIYRIGRKLGALPFDWDPKIKQVKAPTSKFLYVRWYISVGYILFNTCFMTLRLGQAACCMDVTYGKLFMNLFNVITYFCGSAVQINTIIHRTDIIQFVNHLMKTNKYFQQNYGSNIGPADLAGSSARKFTYAIYFYCVTQFFVALRTIDKNPKYLFTLTGIVGLPRWKVLPFAIFECFMSFHIASVLLFYVVFFVSYVLSTSGCIKIIGIQDIALFPRHFRMLQTVNNQFNLCYRATIVPFMFFTLLTINIISDYASIRLYHDVPMPGFLAFPLASIASLFIIFDTIPAAYEISEASELLIKKNLKECKGRVYFRKFIGSCEPVVVLVGDYFPIKQITMMTFLKILIDNVLMMLLTF